MPAPTSNQTLPLHRVRFFDHTPSPIVALAFPPQPLPAPRDPSTAKGKARDAIADRPELGALVVARENGEVELWQYSPSEEGGMGNWVLHKVSKRDASPSVRRMLIADPPAYSHAPDYLGHGARDP